MKYLIVKGWLGFGDRLESLKMCVFYAQKHNLQIYVDWRDPMWSHGSEDFYTYFNLLMPTFKLEDLPEDATYYPPYWKGNLNEHLNDSFKYERKDLTLHVIDKPFDADVIVYACNGTRTTYADSTFFSNVFRVIDPRILNEVKRHSQAYPLQTSWGIHIRGTDRIKPHKRMFNIQAMVLNIVTQGGMNKPHIVIVSDDKDQAQIIKNYYPNAYTISNFATNSTTGTHMLTKDQLSISKDQLNVEMLIDFFVLAKCERIFTTVNDSRYAQEARRLHQVVNNILS